jgi:hypothetical protein
MARPRAALTLDDLAATRTPPAPAPAKGGQGAAGNGKRSAGGDDRSRRGQTLRLEPEAWRQLKMLAIEQGTTSHDLLIQAVNLLFDHYNRPTIAG